MVAERKREPGRAARSERLELRLTPAERALIQRAADLEDRPVAEFARERLRAAAEGVARAHETWEITVQDAEAIVHALMHPRDPGPALRRAREIHDQIVEKP